MAAGLERQEPLDTTLVVETPEHIRFRHRLAGPTRRLLAYLIDLAVRAGLVFGLGMLAALAGAFQDGRLAGTETGVWLLILFAVEWGYYVVAETLTGGRSLGKQALQLRVIKRSGTPIGFGDSVLRNLLRAADFLPSMYALGAVVMGQDRYFRRLGDLAADTLVVSEAVARVREPLRLTPPPRPAELNRLPNRPDLSASEVEALELLLRRYGALAPTREEELAEMVAPVFAARMHLRYRDPLRFLALLHHKATARSDANAKS